MNGKIYALATDDDNLVIKQVSPNNVHIRCEQIWPLDNGTIVIKEDCNNYMYLYPNGGFEYEKNTMEQQNYVLGKTDEGIMVVKVEGGQTRANSTWIELVASFYDYGIGTSVGGNVIAEQPFATIDGSFWLHWDGGASDIPYWNSKIRNDMKNWPNIILETANSYLIGSCFTMDKKTKQMTELSKEQSDHVIIPDKDNMYDDLVWEVSADGASWFNINTLEYGSTSFKLSLVGAFQQTEMLANIQAGEVIIAGVRYSDGKQIVCVLKIDTGQLSYSVNDSERPITALIPLNE